MFVGAKAVAATQNIDVSKLSLGEVPRVSILSIRKDQARVVYDHILGSIQASPRLSRLLYSEPTGDTITLMHPSGRPVEIRVVAGARAGSSVVARWSAGVIFDEAPRMIGADDGVVNFDDSRRACLGRLLPGAQILAVGSPWAPFGPVYDAVTERHGKPGPDMVVIRAPAPDMNPVYWTPERIEQIRTDDAAVYRTDILGEFADLESAMFLHEQLAACTRAGLVVEPEHGHHYWACMDPATRGNAWTLAIGCLDAAGRVVVVAARQWIGSSMHPLSPVAIMADIAGELSRYGCLGVTTDQYSADALVDIGIQHGLAVTVDPTTARGKIEMFEGLRTLVADCRIELPPDPVLLEDLRRVSKVVTQSGVRIELPKTADGRHADYAPAVAMLAKLCVAHPAAHQVPPKGWHHDELREVERLERKHRAPNDQRPFYSGGSPFE